MTRRIALACFYTLFVAVLLTAWRPTYTDDIAAIATLPIARWLLMPIPVYWGWAALGLENRWARRISIAASAILFVACFLFITDQDHRDGPFCLWDGPGCGSPWFN